MIILRLIAAAVVAVILTFSVKYVRTSVAKMQSRTTDADKEITAVFERDDLPSVQPGEIAFTRAKEYLATGDLNAAKEKLLYIVNFHPRTASATEARRILGEMNMDQILSLENMENKKIHKVVRGEAFNGIAGKYKSTLDIIMFLNGLTGFNRLYPGDDIVVMELDFRAVIDLDFRVVRLTKNGEFVKEYRMLALETAPIKKQSITTIAGKTGRLSGKSVQPGDPLYRGAHKVLSLKGSGLQICSSELQKKAGKQSEDQLSQGVFLAPSDVEELMMVLRVGNEVEIRPTAH